MPIRAAKYLSGFRCIAAVCAFFVAASATASDWQLEVDQDNIKLFTRQGEASPMKTYKVETRIKATLSSLVAFLNDEKSFPKWMDKVAEVEKIRDINEQESLVYQVIDAPWPAKDQDNILYSKWTQDPNTLAVTKDITAEPMFMKEKSNRRRQSFYKASWTLIPEGNGMVKVEYSAEIDPGVGEVKEWMEKMLAFDMPFKTIRNFRRANLDNYAGNKFAFIQEPSRSELVMAE
ncbi:MAG: START domain-containing protein [Pseudomonadales bacterium]|nr:START domain-containing protein [Pseudomonadales bacterium]